MDLALALEQLIRSLLLQVCYGYHGSLLIQSTCSLWTWRGPMRFSGDVALESLGYGRIPQEELERVARETCMEHPA